MSHQPQRPWWGPSPSVLKCPPGAAALAQIAAQSFPAEAMERCPRHLRSRYTSPQKAFAVLLQLDPIVMTAALLICARRFSCPSLQQWPFSQDRDHLQLMGLFLFIHP